MTAVERDLRYLRWDFTTGASEMSLIASVEPEHEVNRFNDGKCDARGRMVAGERGRTERLSVLRALFDS